MSPQVILENHLQPELHQSSAWGCDQPTDVTGASLKDAGGRKIKMGLVEQVKNLRPGLHVDPLGRFEGLGQRSIGIEKPRSYEGVSAQVAIGPFCRPGKGARVIPMVWSSQRCS